MEPNRDPELTAYIVVLREALQDLVKDIRFLETCPSPLVDDVASLVASSTSRAEAVLRMETGRHAQEELRIRSELVCEGYTLAHWCYYGLYHVPRARNGFVPTMAEVRDALAAIDTLTKESWALDALLEETPHGHEHTPVDRS